MVIFKLNYGSKSEPVYLLRRYHSASHKVFGLFQVFLNRGRIGHLFERIDQALSSRGSVYEIQPELILLPIMIQRDVGGLSR